MFILGWLDVTKTWDGHLVQKCQEAGYHFVNCDNLMSTDIVFLLDEGQTSYRDLDLWNLFIKRQSGGLDYLGPRMCIFASYGSQKRANDELTPVRLGSLQLISITKLSTPETPDVCLYYSEEEFRDAVDRICSSPGTTYSLEPEARSYLYSVTKGAVATPLCGMSIAYV